MGEPNTLYSVLLLDYGIPQLEGGQYVHWWIANVENGFAVDKGQEVIQYLAPFGFMRNEDETEIDQSYRGKRIHDIVALVYKQNTGRISTTEDFCSNCGYPDLVDYKDTERACCGEHPHRFPYKPLSGERGCCGGQTFDTTLQECCADNVARISC